MDIYCTAARMTPYVSIKYSDKVNPERFDGVPVRLRPDFYQSKNIHIIVCVHTINMQVYIYIYIVYACVCVYIYIYIYIYI